MKKIKNMKLDVKMIAAAILVVVMTCTGVTFMENDWYETMSGIIWLVGEAMLVAVVMYKDIIRFTVEEIKTLFDDEKKLLEE